MTYTFAPVTTRVLQVYCEHFVYFHCLVYLPLHHHELALLKTIMKKIVLKNEHWCDEDIISTRDSPRFAVTVFD